MGRAIKFKPLPSSLALKLVLTADLIKFKPHQYQSTVQRYQSIDGIYISGLKDDKAMTTDEVHEKKMKADTYHIILFQVYNYSK